MNYYDLVELASSSPVIKRYGLDPEVVVMFALVMDKHVHIKPNFDLHSHDNIPRVKLGRGNVSITKFAKMLSRGMQEVFNDNGV